MAQIPTTRPAHREKTEVSDKTNPDAIVFDDHEDMPGAAAINAKVNPYQAKVNELARTGRTASFLIPLTDAKHAREQIRRAANNIKKGASTREVPEKHPHKPDVKHVRIYFHVREMQSRPRNAETAE